MTPEHMCGAPVAHTTVHWLHWTTQSWSHVTWQPLLQLTEQPGPSQCCMHSPVQVSEHPAPEHVWLHPDVQRTLHPGPSQICGQSPVQLCLHPGDAQVCAHPSVQPWEHAAAVHSSAQPTVHCWEQSTSPPQLHEVPPFWSHSWLTMPPPPAPLLEAALLDALVLVVVPDVPAPVVLLEAFVLVLDALVVVVLDATLPPPAPVAVAVAPPAPVTLWTTEVAHPTTPQAKSARRTRDQAVSERSVISISPAPSLHDGGRTRRGGALLQPAEVGGGGRLPSGPILGLAPVRTASTRGAQYHRRRSTGRAPPVGTDIGPRADLRGFGSGELNTTAEVEEEAPQSRSRSWRRTRGNIGLPHPCLR
jgi:hypothetical protein